MPNLFATLNSAANAMRVFDRALAVSQNNVLNAQTPGYARQQARFDAMPFQPAVGLLGGVKTGALQNTRNNYSELAVQQQTTALGSFSQQAGSLAAIEGVFDVSGDAGIPKALQDLFNSFSTWGVSPNSPIARQAVLTAAGGLAVAFQQTSGRLSAAASQTDSQLRELTKTVNSLTSDIRDYNVKRRSTPGDTGLDPGLYHTLEQLSEVINFTPLFQEDGTVTILAGGQLPLVVGENLNQLSVNTAVPSSPLPVNTGAPPSTQILDSSGLDITNLFTGGRIGGLLQFRNGVLANLQGSAGQQGSLNQLAQQLADRINSIFGSGIVAMGPPAQAGIPLFTYDGSRPASVAGTLAVNPAITPDTLAAASPGPPQVSNGVPLALGRLAQPEDSADQIGGLSYLEFYGQIASGLGRQLQEARNGEDRQTALVTQAHTLRAEISGVSLDEEAVHLMELQRSYQAAAKMVAVVDELTATVINMLK